MTSTWDVNVEHDIFYYTLHVLNKKIMLMMNLFNMYILFYFIIYYQHMIYSLQGCQQYSLILIYEYD